MQNPKKNLVECFGCGGVQFKTTEHGTACMSCGRIEWPVGKPTNIPPVREDSSELEALFAAIIMVLLLGLPSLGVWYVYKAWTTYPEPKVALVEVPERVDAPARREETFAYQLSGVYEPKPCGKGKKLRITTMATAMSYSSMEIPCVNLTTTTY